MTTDQEKYIAEALDKRTKSDRLFAYILLIVVTFVVSVVGYNMSGLISSLSANMQSISSDIKTMRNEMVSISHNMESLDSSVSIITSDIQSATGTHEDIAQSVKHLNINIKKMQEDITDMNKMNPLRKIF
jgi:peptidoglycan hydrolase CwlO-like protein